jgi:hypothetical protein
MGFVEATCRRGVTVVTHLGGHAGLGTAYDELVRWTHQGRHRDLGPSWESFGDWDEDPDKRRTDVYLILDG